MRVKYRGGAIYFLWGLKKGAVYETYYSGFGIFSIKTNEGILTIYNDELKYFEVIA